MFKWWASVSSRERRLVALTAAIVILSAGYYLFIQATDRLSAMDAMIDGLEQDLVFYTEQMEVLDEVDRAYAVIASEHSSEWTQEEIHDRLRREIGRLSLMEPPPPGAEVSLSGGGERLVDIRQMPQGTLSASTTGFREYQITFRTQPTSIENITSFLARLHTSPQALRIAQLELTREANARNVSARITVIRNVIDTEKAGPSRVPDPSKNWLTNSGFEDWESDRAPDGWTVERAEAVKDEDSAVEGQQAALITAADAGGMLYQSVALPAGAPFELEFSIRSTGPVTLRAVEEASGQFIGAKLTLEPQPTLQRCRVRLSIPREYGETVAIRAPVFVMDSAGVQFAVDDVVLHEVEA